MVQLSDCPPLTGPYFPGAPPFRYSVQSSCGTDGTFAASPETVARFRTPEGHVTSTDEAWMPGKRTDNVAGPLGARAREAPDEAPDEDDAPEPTFLDEDALRRFFFFGLGRGIPVSEAPASSPSDGSDFCRARASPS